MSLALFFAQHVSNASTIISRSMRLCVGILLWFDVCWRYGVVRLGWCGIVMQDEALVPQPAHSRKLLKHLKTLKQSLWLKPIFKKLRHVSVLVDHLQGVI